MSSIFTKIIQREIPAHIIEENEHAIAFLDVSPVAKGHTLVVPKKEVDVLYHLEDEAYQALWAFAKKIAKKIENALPCKRVGIAVIGLEVPHAHIHLIPILELGDMDFKKERMQFSNEEFAQIAENIKNTSYER